MKKTIFYILVAVVCFSVAYNLRVLYKLTHPKKPNPVTLEIRTINPLE